MLHKNCLSHAFCQPLRLRVGFSLGTLCSTHSTNFRFAATKSPGLRPAKGRPPRNDISCRFVATEMNHCPPSSLLLPRPTKLRRRIVKILCADFSFWVSSLMFEIRRPIFHRKFALMGPTSFTKGTGQGINVGGKRARDKRASR